MSCFINKPTESIREKAKAQYRWKYHYDGDYETRKDDYE